MKDIVFSLVLLCLIFSFQVFSQNSERKLLAYYKSGQTVKLSVNDGLIEIVSFSDKVVHVSFYPLNAEVENFSFAVEKLPEPTSLKLKEEKNTLEILTGTIKIEIQKDPFSIRYFTGNKLLLAEKEGYIKTDTNHIMQLSLEKDEILYGGGTRVLGMNRRGNKLKLYNKAHYGYETESELMNYTMPMYISSKKYAVLFDNASIGYLDLDSRGTNTLEYGTISGTMNYYVFAGENWYDLIDQYTLTTGRQPLPPLWSFGSYSSRFGYHSQEEVISTVQKFMDEDIPVEAAIIDIYWFGPEIFDYMGNLDWYRDSFPEPEKMIRQLNEWGVKTILVTEPFILTTSTKWDEAVEKEILGTDKNGNPYTYDFYFGNTGLIDIFKPEAREWFWSFYRDFTAQGIGGWWGDLGEPEVHPSGLQHVIGSADEVHNAYGHEWLRLVYEGYEEDFPEQRPFILMRSGYAGSQKYGIIPWTGDVNRTWGGLVPQVELSLQMGMQGIAYMHSDLGGFADGDTIDNELYIRWLQYGVFQPIFRPHAQEHIPSEPVFQIDSTKQHAKNAIELRYKLLPYIYTMAFENNQTGKPLMIPLFFNDADNPDLLTYDDAYMWGDALLVSPVKEPAKKHQEIYLPEGNSWTHFFTEDIHEGGQKISQPLTIDHIPVFVRGGSFLPILPEAKQIKHYSLSNFEIHYYHDENVTESQYSLYNDDGVTPESYEKHQYELINFYYSGSENKMEIGIDKESGRNFRSEPSNQIRLAIHNMIKKPQSVRLNEQIIEEEDIIFRKEKNILIITATLQDEPLKITISK